MNNKIKTKMRELKGRVIKTWKNKKGRGMNDEDVFLFIGNDKNVKGILSPHVFIIIFSVCDAQFYPDIPYRL